MHCIGIVAHCASLSQHRTATERFQNATSLCSPAQVHITTPTSGVLRHGNSQSRLPFATKMFAHVAAYAQLISVGVAFSH